MTNREIKAQVSTARYALEPLDVAAIERTLRNLPKKQTKPLTAKLAIAVPAAAAIMAFMIFAAPPIVKAVGVFIEQVFTKKAAEIEEYQALPEDEKVAMRAAEYDEDGFGHSLNDVSTDFGGVTMTASSMWMWYPDKRLTVHLNYSARPTFDPEWIDFTLSFGGKRYAYVPGTYREMGLHLPEADYWNSDEYSWDSNSRLKRGTYETDVHFIIGDTSFTENTPMVLTGTYEGETFELTFELSPERGREENAQLAAEQIAGEDPSYGIEEVDALKAFAERALPVGAKGTLNGNACAVSEMAAMDDGTLHFALAFENVDPSDGDRGYMSYRVRELRVDGEWLENLGSDNSSVTDGVLTYLEHAKLRKSIAEMPETSVICLYLETIDQSQGEDNAWDDSVFKRAFIAFEYNWKTRSVTLAKDDQQLEKWIEASGIEREP